MQIHDLLPTLNSFTESESVKESEWNVKSEVESGKQPQTEAQTQEHIKSMQFTEW